MAANEEEFRERSTTEAKWKKVKSKVRRGRQGDAGPLPPRTITADRSSALQDTSLPLSRVQYRSG